MAVRNRVCGPTQCGITAMTPRCTKSGGKLDGGQRMPGAGLSCRRSRKAPLGKPTFQPYWGKPAVRNDRGDRGNVGIIRSPIRASILPDSHYRTSLAATNVDSSCAAQPNFHDDRQRSRHLHSMTRSARFSISAGTVTPSSRAVLRLITSWCFEKTSIAVSAGFAPLRILSTYTGTRGYVDV